MTQKWAGYPNLRLRPVKPALGRGRLQIQVRRAFLATGEEVLSSSAIYDWTHVPGSAFVMSPYHHSTLGGKRWWRKT
jgi:hypothetical protein